MLNKIKKGFSVCYQFYINVRALRANGWKIFYSSKLKLRLLLNLDNLIDFLIHEKGVFEEEVLLAVEKIQKDDSFLFVDVGSQLGQFSLFVKKRYPRSQVLSFEPLEEAYIQQKSNMQINKINYTLYNCALSNNKGETSFFRPANSYRDAYGKRNLGMASLLSDLLVDAKEMHVFTALLDDFENIFEKHQCIILKIDVEGGESLVLSGAVNLLQSNRDVYIIIELLHESLPERSREVDSFLQSLGYSLCNVHWEKDLSPKLKNGNYFYRRSR